jgi:hypothetical protein
MTVKHLTAEPVHEDLKDVIDAEAAADAAIREALGL